MSHGKALKALARKRLKVIYAVMRDRGALRRLAEAHRTDWSPTGRMAWRQHAAIQSRGQHFPVTKTIRNTPRRLIAAACICDTPFA